MKATGIVRRIDELGRVVLPIELRKNLDLKEKDPLEIYVDGNSIILKKFEPACIFCGSNDEIVNYKGKNICGQCIREMTK
ncbi:MAG: AbrB/MazE/SpoVT family DNA-binding domain-containing protein [Oscillospiraceae bacterium]|nr:AbrB/MazE/SpoVT family DNA-binding domain-containing protein [Oscillospiraceae bacterium]